MKMKFKNFYIINKMDANSINNFLDQLDPNSMTLLQDVKCKTTK